MKIPKYIDDLLERRAKAAMDFIAADVKISAWLDQHNIVVSADDINTGALSLCEPYNSIDNIRNCIEESDEL